MNRREFTKLAAAGAVTLPILAGLRFVHGAQGTAPPSGSPYTDVAVLEGWPSRADTASPLLLLVNERSSNPFGLYLSEILRTEGLNSFQVATLSSLHAAPLDWYDAVILAEGPLDQAQAETLSAYVLRGGSLVAMRPDRQIAHLCGLETASGAIENAYLQVIPNHPVSEGIAGETLQFHGQANLHRLAGGQMVARLTRNAETALEFPALVIQAIGNGHAAAWTFDLARSVAYSRQGNPLWANQERDGGDGIRATDMFVQWIDLERMVIPQADEQGRLLANLLTFLTRNRRPLPRLWYFPGAAETMLIATGDSHGNNAAAIEDVLTRVERRGGHMSIYYTAFPSSEWRRVAKKAVYEAQAVLEVADDASVAGGKQTRLCAPRYDHIQAWRARGHEFSLHPYVEMGLGTAWKAYWREFTGLGYGPVPHSVRTHRVLWTGWVESARVQAAHGMRMNLDYYHWGPLFQNEAGRWVCGHFTGSGLPMKFVDEKGRILEIYQQLTQLADDHLLDLAWGGVAKLPVEEALESMRALVQRSLDGEPSAIVAQFHVDPFAIRGPRLHEAERWLEGTLDYAQEKGIPIWSAEEWLRFTEVRHDAELAAVSWNADTGRLSLRLDAAVEPEIDLSLLIPLQHGDQELAGIEADGTTVAHQDRVVGGVRYASIRLPAGPHRVRASYR